MTTLILKEGKEASAGFRHPWLFSGALERPKEAPEHGDVVRVADKDGKILGTGTYSASSSIAVRLFEFKEAEIDRAWFARRFKECDERRKLMGYGLETEVTGYRLVFGESDGVPGLVVDRYEDVLVIQVSTAGMARLKSMAVEALKEVFAPKAIIERSDLPVRREENLEEESGILFGSVDGSVKFQESGLKFSADVLTGQKTGFFLDQRDLRSAIRRLAGGRDVLNLFSYTGAASVAALKGGAKHVLNVDASAEALAVAQELVKLNKISAKSHGAEEADVFQWLGTKKDASFGMVLLDPPALIKGKKDLESGAKAYHFLNRAAMRLVEGGGLFVTSSCSHFLSEEDLAFILRRASVQAGLRLDLLAAVRQSPDHPMNVYFPEGAYLKSFVFQIRR